MVLWLTEPKTNDFGSVDQPETIDFMVFGDSYSVFMLFLWFSMVLPSVFKLSFKCCLALVLVWLWFWFWSGSISQQPPNNQPTSKLVARVGYLVGWLVVG